MTQPWGQLYRRDHVNVLGPPGCGKSPFMAELVASARRVVFFDPVEEFTDLGTVVEAGDLVADPDLLAGVTCRIVVQPRPRKTVEDFAITERACREARAHGGLVLVADEIHLLSATGEGQLLLRELYAAGHKDGVATLMASPCWTDFPARCRKNASRVYCFAQHDANDIAELNRQLGLHVPGFGDKAAAWAHPAPPVAWVSPTLHE